MGTLGRVCGADPPLVAGVAVVDVRRGVLYGPVRTGPRVVWGPTVSSMSAKKLPTQVEYHAMPSALHNIRPGKGITSLATWTPIRISAPRYLGLNAIPPVGGASATHQGGPGRLREHTDVEAHLRLIC